MDNRGRTVVAAFGSYRSVRTAALWQWDRGQLLQVSGITLPAAWEAHVANGGASSDAEIYFGSGDTLAIDNKFLESGAPVVVWIYLHETEDDGETEYVVTIPVQRRKKPEDATPSESEESAIARAIVALNAAVTATAADVTAAEQAKDDAVQAKNAAVQAKDDAVQAKNAAVTAKDDAVQAKNTAVTAKDDAVAAKDAAVQAQGSANQAKDTAVQAQTGAVQAEVAARASAAAAAEAQDDAELAARQAAASETAAEASRDAAARSAQAAAGSATSADGSARAAGAAAQAAAGSAQAAGASETAAGASALAAEGYALGTQGGQPVGQDSTYYENNAKHYSELTAQDARDAEDAKNAAQAASASELMHRITSLNGTPLSSLTVEAVGIPVYVDDVTQYSAYGLTDTGWYIFARIIAKGDVKVTAQTAITGDAGHIATVGADHVDLAIRFEVAAVSKSVTITWGGETETFIFKATDLAVRNLDYRTTFYVYDISPYVTWQFALTSDATFVENKKYYTLVNDEYVLAEVTAGDTVPADTYYNHSKIIFAGMVRNVTYRLNEIIDCPLEFVLPEVPNDGYGAWFEIQLQYDGSYSTTLVPTDNSVKIGTATTQTQNAGINIIDLQYTEINGVKMWTLLNTHSNLPAAT